MKRILLDTNAYVAFKRGEGRAVEVLKGAEYIGVNITVIAELLCGFRGSRREKKNLLELDEFLGSPRVRTVQIDAETAEFYANIYWGLRKKGKPIPTNDIWVAASALQHGLGLFSFDGHFSHIEGLIVTETIF